ncbi:MAG: ABC transporter substrate-binding protein, partial [Nitrospirota bacterium]
MKQKNKITQLLIVVALSAFIMISNYGCEPSPGKTYVVGIVNLNPKLDRVIEGFKSGMTHHGYIEDENISYIYRGPLKSKSELEPALQELLTRKVDFIYTVTTPATLKAKKITEGTGIPVVFAPVFFPVKSGVVKSLTDHGSNITGIQVGGSTAKALEYLLTVDSGIKKILVPFNANNKAAIQSLEGLRKGADKLGVNIVIANIQNENELKLNLESVPEDIDAIWLLNSHFLVSRIKVFMDSAIRHKIPVASGASQYKSGVVISYGQDHFRTGKRAGRLAHRILQGTAPADLPVEITEFFLGINLKTAGKLGIEIPDNI